MPTVEQLIDAQQANFGYVFGALARTFEGFEQLVDLNLQVTKAALADAQASARTALAAKDVQYLAPAAGGGLQPSLDRFSAYVRQALDIIAATNAGIGAMSGDFYNKTQKAIVASLADTAEDRSPANESAAAFINYAASSTNRGFEAMQQLIRQATVAAQAGVAASNGRRSRTKSTT